MLYASSKDALRRALVGIASEIQGTDFSEVAYDEGMRGASSGTQGCELIESCARSSRQGVTRICIRARCPSTVRIVVESGSISFAFSIPPADSAIPAA